eukprot:4452107-Pyramimonas_sp.AAC.1
MLDNACSPKIYPTRGVVAGSSTATYEIKGYMLPAISEATQPTNTDLLIHVGDLGFESPALLPQDCFNQLATLASQ